MQITTANGSPGFWRYSFKLKEWKSILAELSVYPLGEGVSKVDDGRDKDATIQTKGNAVQ